MLPANSMRWRTGFVRLLSREEANGRSKNCYPSTRELGSTGYPARARCPHLGTRSVIATIVRRDIYTKTTESRWRALIAEQDRRGLTAWVFAANRDIKPTTLCFVA